MPDAHARFAPSASSRWINCPGSVPLSEQLLAEGRIPADTSGPAAIRGTLMHECAENHLLEGTDPREDFRTLTKGKIRVTPEEWHPHVINYVEFVCSQVDALDWHNGCAVTLNIEEKVKILGDDCWGSVDANWHADTTLFVDDLKTGYHVVDPEDNYQFKTYAVGLMNEHDWKFTDIFVARSQIQDEENPNSQCRVPVKELKEHLAKIKKAIKNAKSDCPTFEAGSHCKFCPAAAHCKMQMEQTLSVFDDDDEVLKLEAMSDDQLREALALKDQVMAFFKSIDAHIIERVQSTGFKGYKMVEGVSRRKWDPSKLDQVVSFMEMMAIDPFKEKELRNVTDLEKTVGKNNLDQFMIKPPGKPTLVPESDRRKAIGSADIFDDGEVE